GHTVRPEDAAPLYVRDKVALTIEERQAVQLAKAAAAGAQP
ncbi:MAG: tRNA (adenosine(37)-N6)-threonylcarbamoyltransferase complex dimerization subunit type 1 TsaB, partial [Ralstonia sp.]|nr:tRNA (adenosine(37)-N6)-threonylcarbamoyltransferase complex dimerization subunit type 1 TsaB [Ralstonia sp.]